jgi:chitin disaccharide deacetylase
MEIYIGIPCYRVATSIAGVLDRITATGIRAHIILVNDGSPDTLDEVVASLDTTSFLSFTYHTHPENRGYGAAQKTLFGLFLEKAKSPDDLLIFVHGDGQTDESELTLFVNEAETHPEADFILGSRMLNPFLVQRRAGRPFYKILGDYGLATMFNIAFGRSYSTFAIGYRAHRKRGVEKLDFNGMTNAHTFDMEFMIRLGRCGVTYREVCLRVVQNDTGFSANRLSKFIQDSIGLFFRYLFSMRHIGRAYLIVNADDYGYVESINKAIESALKERVITSASLLANMPAFDDAVARAKAGGYTDRLGVHINLSEGMPLGTGYRTLVDKNGAFMGIGKLVGASLAGSLDPAELRKEIDLQVTKVQEAGITPSHLDTHQWSQILPEVAFALDAVARTHQILCVRNVRERVALPMLLGASWRALFNTCVIGVLRLRASRSKDRPRSPEHYYGIILTGHAFFERSVASLIRTLPRGTSELMCHIGSTEHADLDGKSYYARGRAKELQALHSESVRKALEARGATLISYREL